jgi:hypothetical protein
MTPHEMTVRDEARTRYLSACAALDQVSAEEMAAQRELFAVRFRLDAARTTATRAYTAYRASL